MLSAQDKAKSKPLTKYLAIRMDILGKFYDSKIPFAYRLFDRVMATTYAVGIPTTRRLRIFLHDCEK